MIMIIMNITILIIFIIITSKLNYMGANRMEVYTHFDEVTRRKLT